MNCEDRFRTVREKEVLSLIADGYIDAEIAARLEINSRVVETHRANLMRKLGLPAFKFFGIGRVLGPTANE